MSAGTMERNRGKRVVERHRRSFGQRQRRSRRSQERISPKQQWQLIQLVVSGSLFVLLVAVTWFLPGGMEKLNETLSHAMERNMDVQEVFSAVGRAFSGEDDRKAIYQAVFGAKEMEEPSVIEVGGLEEAAAWKTLQKYRQESSETTSQEDVQPPSEVETLAYVLYSEQNLPENVSMEQAILGFDYCQPLKGSFSSGFGHREHPTEGEGRFHYGIDMAADTGTDICSFADGNVTAVGESSSYGKYCIITHEGNYRTLYAHCSRITAVSGTAVQKGQKIAEVGETGIATGPHLHFELQREGVYLNPIYYLEQA